MCQGRSWVLTPVTAVGHVTARRGRLAFKLRLTSEDVVQVTRCSSQASERREQDPPARHPTGARRLDLSAQRLPSGQRFTAELTDALILPGFLSSRPPAHRHPTSASRGHLLLCRLRRRIWRVLQTRSCRGAPTRTSTVTLGTRIRPPYERHQQFLGNARGGNTAPCSS